MRPDVIRTNFAFGLVESWWVGSERRRKSGPCVETSKWNTRLLKSGFSGSDVVFPDNQDPKCQDLSIICSTAVGRQQEQSKLLVNLQYLPNDSKQAEIAYAIERRITQSRNFGVSHGLIPQDGLAGPSKGTFQICLFELNRPAILDVSKEAFKYLRKMLTTQRNILWVNGGGGASPDPRYRVAEGLFRSLCQEDSRIKITALSLDRDIQGAEHPTCQVMKIIDLLSQRTSANVDDWYIERDGSLHIARVVDATDLNHRLYVQSLPQQNRIQPFANGTRLQIAIGAPGSPHTIQFVRDATHNYPLGPTEIEVEVKAIGVMSSDHSLTTGRIPGGSPGQGFAGIVTRVGTACQRFYEGDRVVACHPGCYRSHVRLDENMTIVKLPAAVSFCQAAGLFLSYTAAWVALQDIAVLKAGETILIQYGGEAAAQAAIQIALNLGAAIFTTVESATEKQLLIDRYGVLPERIFSGGSPHLVDGIRSLTARRGADVIFNSRSGGESWECIAPYGRYVEIVQSDVTSNSTIPVDVLRNNVCLSSINLGAMSIDKPGVVISTMAEILGLLERQLLRPPGPLHVYRISDLDDALRSSASSQSLATSVVEIGAEDPVSVRQSPPFSSAS